jgi:hypothetical protein
MRLKLDEPIPYTLTDKGWSATCLPRKRVVTRTFELEGVTYYPFEVRYWLREEGRARTRRLTVYAPAIRWVRQEIYARLDAKWPARYRVIYSVRDLASGQTWRITETGFYIPSRRAA